MNKKTKIAMLGVIAIILVTIGITYAYWLVTKTQTGENTISSACLDIAISNEANDISLTNQFPLSDEDGMKLTPYEFTVTNNCNTSLDYQIALEATGTESSAITTSALKVALDDTITLLSNNAEIDPTISGAYESRKLTMGTLGSKESIRYSLRLWIDADAPVSEMNKTFKSKVSVTVGQGIENSSITEGTLAYSILSNYGGASSLTTQSATWIDGEPAAATYTSTRASSTYSYYWATDYDLDETTGKYTLSGDIVQATTAECRAGTKTCGSYTFVSTNSTTSNNYVYYVTSLTNESKADTSTYYYITTQKITAKNDFSTATTSSDAGLYKTEDDLGDSYYFRGNPKNNYVQFGAYAANSEVNGTTYTEETPIYWRIVRINGDGTVRLVYDGTEKAENGTSHTSVIGYSAYNSNYDAEKYVGYTYEGTNESGETVQVDSTIKGVVDAWYDAHLEANYGSKIADGIFCNDRSVTSYYDYDNGITTTTKPTGTYDAYYGANTRYNSKTPSVKCANQSDRYTVDDTTNGNGLLSNPVGLVTVDEEIFAGNPSSNTAYYLYNDDYYWTSTPYIWGVDGGYAFNCVDYGGSLSNSYVDEEGGVRPVINLKADVLFEGNGTIDSPYKIVTE